MISQGDLCHTPTRGSPHGESASPDQTDSAGISAKPRQAVASDQR